MSIEKDAARPIPRDRRMSLIRSGDGSQVARSFALSGKSYSISFYRSHLSYVKVSFLSTTLVAHRGTLAPHSRRKQHLCSFIFKAETLLARKSLASVGFAFGDGAP